MLFEVLEILLLLVIIGFEIVYLVRDRNKEEADGKVQTLQIEILQNISKVLTDQKEVLEDSQAELADIRDEMVEEQDNGQEGQTEIIHGTS